jgi:hypothetical protein
MAFALCFSKLCPQGPHGSGPRCLPPWGLTEPSLNSSVISRPRSTRTANSWCTSGPPSNKGVLVEGMAEQPGIGLATSTDVLTMTRGATSPHSSQGQARTSLRRPYSSGRCRSLPPWRGNKSAMSFAGFLIVPLYSRPRALCLDDVSPRPNCS